MPLIDPEPNLGAKKEWQYQFVLRKMEENGGQITRNECLNFYSITRLASAIHDLEERGYRFSTERRDGDYIYHLVGRPRLKY